MRNSVPKLLAFVIILITIVSIACGAGAPSAPTSADLFVVVGNYASHFAGNGNGDGLLLDQFRKENNVSMYVQIANDREMKDFKDQMVSNVEGAPDIMIVDDSLLTDNLQNVKLIASHHVGIAIRSDVADRLGIKGNVIPFADYAQYSKNGQLLVAGSNALAGYDSAEFFFSTMAWCSNTDASNLTAEIIQQEYVRQCGKEIYDHIKSTNGSNDAAKLVLNSGSNGYNSLIAFDSALLGNSGLNAQIGGGNFFKFFYFKEATAKAKLAIGTKDFGKDQAKKDTANLLIEYFLSDNSQKEINLAGFTEGSSALVEHYDTAFKSEWGVSSNPVGVQIVNPPLSNVATNALLIYRDMYKRTKITKACIDVSPSMLEDWMSIDINGESTSVYRIQALNRAILKITDPKWLEEGQIVPGPGDVFEYYFFSVATSDLVVSSIGPDTQPAGKYIDSLIGPWNENDPNSFNMYAVTDRLSANLDGFQSNGTEMFDCANTLLNQIKSNYNSETDYIIVILTDGQNNDKSVRGYEFYENWKAFGANNITVIGIAFGTDGASINPGFTAQFNGTTIKGDNDQELIDAFKNVLGN